jgi:hypothetical protein
MYWEGEAVVVYLSRMALRASRIVWRSSVVSVSGHAAGAKDAAERDLRSLTPRENK